MAEPFRLNVENRSISGLIHLPSNHKPPCVITCHGLFSSKESDKFISIADYFTQRGIAVLRFDFGGCGESSGSFAETTVSGRLRDLAEVVAFARQHPLLASRLGLLGSSLGGFLSLLYAAQDPSIRALSVWATPLSLHELRYNIPAEQVAALKEDFFIDAQTYNLAAILSTIKNIQIIHGGKDAIVPCLHAEEIFKHVTGPKELEIIPQGDHSLTDVNGRQRALALSCRWFQNHL